MNDVQSLPPGTKVQYTGNETPIYIGHTGVVEQEFDRYVTLRWDHPLPSSVDVSSPMKRNLTRVTDPMEIEAALAVLRAAGEVSFKPRKPPFHARRVRLNVDYDAIVGNEDVRVGCQTIDFDAIEEVYNAVQAARAYNREPHSD